MTLNAAVPNEFLLICEKLTNAHWVKRLGGVAINALESHARLARAAGITVEIVREGGAMDLGDALRAQVLTRAHSIAWPRTKWSMP